VARRAIDPLSSKAMKVHIILGAKQTAFEAIEAVDGQGHPNFRHMVVRSDSVSAIARARHTGVGPGQQVAVRIIDMLPELFFANQWSSKWVKSRSRKSSRTAGVVTEHFPGVHTSNSRYQKPGHHGTRKIPPRPPKKSCLDRVRNAIARVATQMQTDQLRSAVFLRGIRKAGLFGVGRAVEDGSRREGEEGHLVERVDCVGERVAEDLCSEIFAQRNTEDGVLLLLSGLAQPVSSVYCTRSEIRKREQKNKIK